MSMGLYQRYNKVYQRYKKQFKSGFIFETQQPVQDPQAAGFSVILTKIYKFSDIKKSPGVRLQGHQHCHDIGIRSGKHYYKKAKNRARRMQIRRVDMLLDSLKTGTAV